VHVSLLCSSRDALIACNSLWL